MRVLIRRQDAIDTLEIYAEMLRRVLDDMDVVRSDRDRFAWELGVIESLMSDMKELPSEESERKKGKWVGYNVDNPDWLRDDGNPVFLTCSECHETVLNNGSAHWNFCPNCGSCNGGEEDG